MIKVVKAERTCSACPSQWDCWTEEGDYIYVRYRWGYLCISWDVMGEVIYDEQVGDGFDGSMSYDELVRHTEGVIEWPEYDEDAPGPLYLINFNTGEKKTMHSVEDVIKVLEELNDEDGTDTSDA